MRKLTQEFRVGVIARPHGVHGEVNVFPTTDDPGRLRELEELILVPPRGERRIVRVEGVKFVKKFVVLKLRGFDTVESVERLRSGELLVDRAHAIPLEEGECYIADIIGLSVIDDDSGEVLGEIVDVIETGANDVYEMERAAGDGPNVLFPAIPECIRQISPEEGIMRVHVMKGLI